MSVRRRLILGAFALLVAAWVVAEISMGGTGLLSLSPVLPLVVPLMLGRYIGEQRLAAFAGRGIARRRRRIPRAIAPRSRPRAMQRGGWLVASAMAKRPPPAPCLARS
jgi:hypothetical protein